MFSILEGHFSFCVIKRKVPGKGLGKRGDGVPSSLGGIRRDKLRRGKEPFLYSSTDPY